MKKTRNNPSHFLFNYGLFFIINIDTTPAASAKPTIPKIIPIIKSVLFFLSFEIKQKLTQKNEFLFILIPKK